MSVCVRWTPTTRETRRGTTSAISSYFRTRTMATRSYSPVTEYTSDTPAISRSASATSSVSPGSVWMRTIDVITAGWYRRGAPAADRVALDGNRRDPAQNDHAVAGPGGFRAAAQS